MVLDLIEWGVAVGVRRLLVLVVALLALAGVMAPVEAQESEPPDPSELVEVFAAVDDVEGTETGELVVVDVLSNDGDGDGDGDDPGAALVVVTAPGSGVAVVGADEGEPVIAYTPAAGFGGVDSFSYRACVGGVCDEASVSVYVGTSACTILGTNGANTLVGTEGNDVICGRGGDDVIDGLGGNDLVFGGRGNDTLRGGAGVDVVAGGVGGDSLDGGDGGDRLHGGPGADTLTGGVGDDELFGGRGVDTVEGGDGNDLVRGGLGADTLTGGAGDDNIRGGVGVDTVDGGVGNDLLFGGRGNDTLNGGTGNDTIRGGRGDDGIVGGDGVDGLFGNRGNDTLDGGPDADTLNGGPGTDVLDGGGGSNTCSGGETVTNCGQGLDVTPPVAEVVVVDRLAADGVLEIGLSASDDVGVASVALMSPDGYLYEVSPIGAGQWSAAINASRLFAGDVYDFVYVVSDAAGNATVSEVVSVTVPEREAPAPAVTLDLGDGAPLSELLVDFAHTGVEPFEFVHSRLVTGVDQLPEDLQQIVADNPDEATNFVGRHHVGVASVNGVPLSLIGDLYEGLYLEQGGVGDPIITAVRAVAPSAAAAAEFESETGGTVLTGGVLGGALRYAPSGGDGWTTEPFWPTSATLGWSNVPGFRVDDEAFCAAAAEYCGIKDLFGDVPSTDFAGRRISGTVTGLDEFFRPYYGEYTERAYEFDVAQINTEVDDANKVWVQYFPGSVLEALDAITHPVCEADSGDAFPIARLELERTTSHDVASIQARRGEVRFSLFETNVNAEASPYPDSFVGDWCREMDLSFGIARPWAVDPGLSRLTYSFTAARGTVDTAGLALEHQTLDAHPGSESSVKALLCESWSSGGSGIGTGGVLGTNFCTGVVTGDTGSVVLAANSEQPSAEEMKPPPVPATVPWLPISFVGGVRSACFELTAPEVLHTTTRVGDAQIEVGYQLGWGLADVITNCSALRSSANRFQVVGSQMLPPLVAGEFYNVQLRLLGDQSGSWSVLENPLFRYAAQRGYPGSLPGGLSLDPVTGVISGVPTQSTDRGPLYVTVGVVDGDKTAVRQLMFDTLDQHFSATALSSPLPAYPGQEVEVRFTVTNDGATAANGIFVFGTIGEFGAGGLTVASVTGAVCGGTPEAPWEYRCDLGAIPAGASIDVVVDAVVTADDFFMSLHGWHCLAGAVGSCQPDFQRDL